MKLLTSIMTSLVLLGAGELACAADQQTTFDQANTAFAQKNYRRAANDCQAIITQQGFSAPVLFNLANAYYQDGNLGLAILNYERAQLLAPGDADIAFNLHLARAKAGLADRPKVWFDRAASFFSLNTLSWIGGAAVLFDRRRNCGAAVHATPSVRLARGNDRERLRVAGNAVGGGNPVVGVASGYRHGEEHARVHFAGHGRPAAVHIGRGSGSRSAQCTRRIRARRNE